MKVKQQRDFRTGEKGHVSARGTIFSALGKMLVSMTKEKEERTISREQKHFDGLGLFGSEDL